MLANIVMQDLFKLLNTKTTHLPLHFINYKPFICIVFIKACHLQLGTYSWLNKSKKDPSIIGGGGYVS